MALLPQVQATNSGNSYPSDAAYRFTAATGSLKRGSLIFFPFHVVYDAPIVTAKSGFVNLFFEVEGRPRHKIREKGEKKRRVTVEKGAEM